MPRLTSSMSAGTGAAVALLCLIAAFLQGICVVAPPYVWLQLALFSCLTLAGLYALLVCIVRLVEDARERDAAAQAMIWNPKLGCLALMSPLIAVLAFGLMRTRFEERTAYQQFEYADRGASLYVRRHPWSSGGDRLELLARRSWNPILDEVAVVDGFADEVSQVVIRQGERVILAATSPEWPDAPVVLVEYDLLTGAARAEPRSRRTSHFDIRLRGEDGSE